MLPENKAEAEEMESLADQALEAIVRSQQLRERARRMREEKEQVTPADDAEHKKARSL